MPRFAIVFILLALLFVGISIPLILEKVGPNPYYGFRIPKTYADKETWYEANRFTGWASLLASVFSIIAIAGTALVPRIVPARLKNHFAFLVWLTPLALSVLISFIYVSML